MLSTLQEKLGGVHGLAIGAASLTAMLVERTPDPSLLRELERMHSEANETRARCLALEETFGEGLAEELVAHANSMSETAADLVGAWFGAGTDPLASWTFLAMGEAGEVAAWTVLGTLASAATDAQILELAEWALPIQECHLRIALDGARTLARSLEPNAPRFG